MRRGHPEWANDEFDRLGRILEGSLDPAARRAAWARMLTIVEEEDPPAAVLHQYAIFYGKRRAISWRAGASEEMDFRPANLSFR